MLLAATDVVQPRRRRIRLVWRPLVLITVASLLFITAVMIVFAWADRAGSLARADRTSQVLALAFERHIGRTLAELEGSLVMIGGVNGTPSSNGGVVTTVGSLGLGAPASLAFDISPSGIAYAGADTTFATVNLST